MPTQEQIERAFKAMLLDIESEHLAEGNNPSAYLNVQLTVRDLLGMAEAALLAARPTPEEHERGIEAATVAHRASTGDTLAAMRVAIAGYLDATGGGND